MRRRSAAAPLLCLLALALAPPAAARGAAFVVEQGSVRFTSPPQMAGSYDSAIGDFGIPLYGGTLTGAVVYAPGNRLGCAEFPERLPASSLGGLPPVLLVDRGDCFFVEKARYGQRAGAAAVLVADHTQEPLLTMAIPEDRPEVAALVQEITIPVVLVQKSVGEAIKSALGGGASAEQEVVVELSWTDSIAHPDDRVEWELWMTTQDACGRACDTTRAFLQSFRTTAQSLEQENFTQFTPHVMTRPCPRWQGPSYCASACIHGGRYCAMNAVPQQYASQYSGAQVVEQNKRSLCAHQAANSTAPPEPWRWWDFAAAFASACTMAGGRFDAACAEEQLKAAGIDVAAVNACMGPSDADAPHPIMQAQVEAQADMERSGRGRVILLPTVVINADQFRGSLASSAVLRALCSGFSEGSEPPVCLSGGLNVDDCASGSDRCWRGEGGLSACVDTFRGYVCRCPAGWEGDGHACTDIDECALGIDGCDQLCVNVPGSYRCACKDGFTLHGGQGGPGMCVPNSFSFGGRLPAWLIAMLIVGSVVAVSVAGLFVYRWRLRREMRGEIHAIMREYLPVGATDAETAALSESLLQGASGCTGRQPRGGGPSSGRGRPGSDTGSAGGSSGPGSPSGGDGFKGLGGRKAKPAGGRLGLGGVAEEGGYEEVRDVEEGQAPAGSTPGRRGLEPLTPMAHPLAASRFDPPPLTEMADLPSPRRQL